VREEGWEEGVRRSPGVGSGRLKDALTQSCSLRTFGGMANSKLTVSLSTPFSLAIPSITSSTNSLFSAPNVTICESEMVAKRNFKIHLKTSRNSSSSARGSPPQLRLRGVSGSFFKAG
jgi:hypothetical protein